MEISLKHLTKMFFEQLNLIKSSQLLNGSQQMNVFKPNWPQRSSLPARSFGLSNYSLRLLGAKDCPSSESQPECGLCTTIFYSMLLLIFDSV